MAQTDWINIIVVDEDESLRKVLTKLLSREDYGVTTASNGEDALELIRKTRFEIGIVDINLPGMNGLTLLGNIKELSPETEIIIITSNACLESAVSALRTGAYDYLTKPFEDLELVSSVVGRAAEKIRLNRENLILIEDLKQSNQELEKVNAVLRDLAIRDGLTGLYNHRYFQEVLAMELARSPRHDMSFCLIFLDVDYFKIYNDNQGHLEGDYVLRTLATILSDSFRKMDLVARYGGEEFVILLPDTSKKEAVRIAEGIRDKIEHYPFKNRETQPSGKITVSIGVASFPENGSDALSLIREADKALYLAKNRGKNMVCSQS